MKRPTRAVLVASLCLSNLFGQSHALEWLTRPYEARPASKVDLKNSPRIYDLIKGGNLYLSLADTIALAIENNLDVEVARLQLPIASTDVKRASGGGTLRGIGLTTAEVPTGVGGPESPLLNSAAVAATPATAVPSDVANLSILQSQTNNTSILPGSSGEPGDFAAGPPIPMYDPNLSGYLYWTRSTIPDAVPFATPILIQDITSNLVLQQGYSLGGTFQASYYNNSENVFNNRNLFNPFSNAVMQFTVTQPLMRGFGTAINRRFIEIAKNDEKITDLSFRQQLINTIFGISRLYYDLAALQQDLHVKRQTLAAAAALYKDTKAQVDEGTVAPVEVIRAEAEVSGAEQDMVNAQGLADEEEVILKSVLTKRGSEEESIRGAHIITTENLTVPATFNVPELNELIASANQHRPDLLQTGLEIRNSDIQLRATRNALLPQLDVVGTYASAGVTGNLSGSTAIDPNLIGGYSNLLAQLFSKKYPTYSVGIQLNLPVRNRVAQADMARDLILRKEIEVRRQQLVNQARLEVEDALVALKRTRAAYDAAVRTRILQEKSLDIEMARYNAGVDTAFFVIQYQSYLAQARSTEVASQSDYFKAKATLDRALGTTLENNGISVKEALQGRLSH